MSELVCPVCKCDSYLNPNIKIYISPCFHKLCESCLYKLFQQGYAPCPECGTLLRRINFINSTFEDVEVERELNMRKLMNRYFQRKEEEFQTEDEYNNYLEEYENILFELLDLRNDSLVKSRMNEIRNSRSVLVPSGVSKSETYDTKKIKTEENWCVYVNKIENVTSIDESVSLPTDFMKPFEPAGLKKREILGFVMYSFRQLLKQ